MLDIIGYSSYCEVRRGVDGNKVYLSLFYFLQLPAAMLLITTYQYHN